MEFKQIKERLDTLLLTMIIASCMFLLSACGGGNSTPNDSKTDTGALSFQVVYHNAAGHRQPQTAVIDCAGEGVSTVEAAVYAPDDAPLKAPVHGIARSAKALFLPCRPAATARL